MRRSGILPDSISSDLLGNWINCIEFDKYGRVWLSFVSIYGIAMYDGKDFTVWDMGNSSLGFDAATNMCVDKERDRVWVSHANVGINCASTAKILGGSTDISTLRDFLLRCRQTRIHRPLRRNQTLSHPPGS